MTVIPIRAGLIDFELVFEALSWRNGALGDSGRPVHLRGAILIEAVEVQRGRLVAQRVQDVHDDGVADVGCDVWNRPLSVDANCRAVKGTIWVGGDPANLKVVGDGGRVDALEEARAQNKLKQTR